MDPSIAEISITSELWVRETRTRDGAGETAAMRRLAATMAADPSKIFQDCAELALGLCRADTCGVSLLERNDAGEEIFRWVALAGELKQHLHGTTPRFFSPCGICVDTSTPLLMRRPELVYKYLDVGPPLHDVLLIPVTEKASEIEGTIWIVSHNPEHKFDLEDARMMRRIAVFIATALNSAGLNSAGLNSAGNPADPGPQAEAASLQQFRPSQKLDDLVKNAFVMPDLLSNRRSVFPVEIHIPDDVAPMARMADMREWLDHRRFEPATFRYSAGLRGCILRVVFAIESQAVAFATEFDGRVISDRTAE